MAKYVTKYKNLRLVLKPTSQQIINNIQQIVPGTTIEFKKGEFSTDNKEFIEFLDNHAYAKSGKIFRVDKPEKKTSSKSSGKSTTKKSKK